MSPRVQRRQTGGARRPRGGGRGSTGRRRGRTAVVVLGAIVLLVVGGVVGAVAMMFGLVPGFRMRPLAHLPTDSARVDSVPVAQMPAIVDSAPQPAAAIPADSAAALAAAGIVLPEDSAAGEAIFRGAGKCLSCHGATGEGVPQLGVNLRDDHWIHSDGSLAAIARTVREGASPPKESPIAMPSFASRLPEESIARVAAYVYAISHPGAVQRDSLAPRPDSARIPPPTVPAPAAAPGAAGVPAPGAPAATAPRPTVPRPTVPAPPVRRPTVPR